MADYQNNAGATRPQGKGGRSRRRKGGHSHHRGGFRNERTHDRRESTPKATGFQKFLSVVTFGLLGKSDTKSSSPSRQLQPIRTPRDAGTSPVRPADKPREGKPARGLPASEEVTTERLYVGNLSYDASESDLFELFSGSGRVKNAEVVVNNRTQRSKGFAFVTMMSVDEAKKAVADLNNKDFMGRPLVVGGAKPLPNAREGRFEREEPDSEAPSGGDTAQAAA